jgi:hypothetical protein
VYIDCALRLDEEELARMAEARNMMLSLHQCRLVLLSVLIAE